jgi:hypothetical protein
MKIEAKDLRIGNLVNYNNEALQLKSIYSEREAGAFNCSVKVEEWLLKLGFTYSDSLTLWMLKNSETIYEYSDDDEDSCNHWIHFYHTGKNVTIESINDHGEYSNLMFSHIKFVHQLQNLFFTMTGKELE